LTLVDAPGKQGDGFPGTHSSWLLQNLRSEDTNLRSFEKVVNLQIPCLAFWWFNKSKPFFSLNYITPGVIFVHPNSWEEYIAEFIGDLFVFLVPFFC
jgi:hypothetical protein